MGQSLEYEIKGTSDVPQQTDKAKKSLTGLAAATEGLNKKFGNFAKDLLISFVAPMVILNTVIGWISSAIDKQRKKIEDAKEFARSEESKGKVSEPARTAAKAVEETKKTKEEEEKAAKAEIVSRTDFLKETAAGQEFMKAKFLEMVKSGESRQVTAFSTSRIEDVNQNVLARLLVNRNKAELDALILANKPAAGEAQKAPSLFSLENSVFGVGSSPGMNLMTQQLEVQTQQLFILQGIYARLPASDLELTKTSTVRRIFQP